jgi:hypothetical protein
MEKKARFMPINLRSLKYRQGYEFFLMSRFNLSILQEAVVTMGRPPVGL